MMERVTRTVGTYMCTSKVGFKKGKLKFQWGFGLRTLDNGFKGSELKRDWRKTKTKDESMLQQAYE